METEAVPQWVRLETPAAGVALVTVTNPSLENQGSWAVIDELADALVAAREGAARVCVIASGVEGHWLEHAWLPDLRETTLGGPTSGDGACWFRVVNEITSPQMISIAAISGDCSGGGAELGWACDLRVAEEQARFSQPEILMNLATGIGGSVRLARLIGRSAAAEMVLDGSPVSAQRLYELGALNRVVPTGRAVEISLAWAKRLATRRATAVAALKQSLQAGERLPLDEALAREQQLFQEVARSPAALDGMKRVQARFDAGESMRAVYDDLAGPGIPAADETRSAPTRRRWLRRLALLAASSVPFLAVAPALPILMLRKIPPPTSAYMLRAETADPATGVACEQVEYAWVDRAEIAPDLRLAVVLAEDQRFMLHDGFDGRSVRRALREREQGRVRGASTISQQVAKNLFLWPGQSYLRKGMEVWLTFWIELLWSKQRILEVYLNLAQFGPCVFGAGAASERFFGVAPRDLGPEEAALLATVLPNPKRLRAHNPGPYASERRAEILELMATHRHARHLRDL